MQVLLITVVLGIIFAIFATQNTATTTIYLGGYTFQEIPIYLIVLVPLLVGLFISYLFHMLRVLSDSLTISEHKDELKDLKKELAEVTRDAHKLELENTKLKAKKGEFDEDSI